MMTDNDQNLALHDVIFIFICFLSRHPHTYTVPVRGSRLRVDAHLPCYRMILKTGQSTVPGSIDTWRPR